MARPHGSGTSAELHSGSPTRVQQLVALVHRGPSRTAPHSRENMQDAMEQMVAQDQLGSVRAAAMQEALPLRRGVPVRIRGLNSSAGAALNGQLGHCDRLDETTGRWGVFLSDGSSKALKADNLFPFDEHVTKPKKLCNFGQSCWRPNCHFKHQDEEQRAAHFAEVWTKKIVTPLVTPQQTQPSPPSVSHPPPAQKPPSELKTDFKILQNKMNAKCKELEEEVTKLRREKKEFEEKMAAFEAECEMKFQDLVDLSQQNEERLEEVVFADQNKGGDKDVLNEKQLELVQHLILGGLQGWAETFQKQITMIETNIEIVASKHAGDKDASEARQRTF